MEEDIEGMNYHHIEAEQQMERMIEDKIEIIDRLSFQLSQKEQELRQVMTQRSQDQMLQDIRTFRLDSLTTPRGIMARATFPTV